MFRHSVKTLLIVNIYRRWRRRFHYFSFITLLRTFFKQYSFVAKHKKLCNLLWTVATFFRISFGFPIVEMMELSRRKQVISNDFHGLDPSWILDKRLPVKVGWWQSSTSLQSFPFRTLLAYWNPGNNALL